MCINKKSVLWILFCCFLLSTAPIRAQQKISTKEGANIPLIHAAGRAQNKRILLRWIATDPIAWQYANQYGYIVERYTVLRNGHVYAGKEKVVLAQGSTMQRIKGDFGKDTLQRHLLTPMPLKPKPVEAWMRLIHQDDNAAIVAQALYGEAPVKEERKNMAGILSNNEGLKQRFAFSLLAADRSFKAAQMAGWGLVDSTVKPNEKYLYRIYTAVPEDKLKMDTAAVYIGLQDYQPLPAPKDLFIDVDNKEVTLSWNFNILKEIYNSYYVERSEDGKKFKKISDLPVVNFTQKQGKAAPAFFNDTLSQYNKPYYYRIVGLTNFDEQGPPSEAVKAIGQQPSMAVPGIRTATMLSDKEVEIEWEFIDSATALIDHFELNQANNNKGPFKLVNNNIQPGSRKIIYNKLLTTNYFTITAVDKGGKKITSFPYLVQPVDSTAPEPPTGLVGTVDSTGKLTLKWKANKETDVMGYMVLKRNLDGEALTVVTKKPFAQTVFTEKVNLKNLNQEVQYAVVALDKRFNQSEPSTIIKVQKPDRIPPTAPVFSGYKIDKGKVLLQWTPSSSPDVAIHKLYRRELSGRIDINWILIKDVRDMNTSSFTDEKVEPGKEYAYVALAVDKSNNESPVSNTITVSMPIDLVKPAVKNLQLEADREKQTITIEWKYSEKNVLEQEIYKATKEHNITLWKVVEADQRLMIDKEIAPGNTYKYAVRVIFKDGSMSAWQEKTIEY